jgi:CheY-like chemotaxis protein
MTVLEAAAAQSVFSGLRVLVVEDETIISFLIEDMLTELGCAEIWHASGAPEALSLLGEKRPDVAVLDVNLRGEMCFPVAERLAAQGIPFIFATGYGREGIPPRWLDHPVVQKPFHPLTLAAGLRAALMAAK